MPVNCVPLSSAELPFASLFPPWFSPQPDDGLDDYSANLISGLLKGNFTVMELDLSGNRIGPEGAGHLAAALLENRTLRTLVLASECACCSPSCYFHSVHCTTLRCAVVLCGMVWCCAAFSSCCVVRVPAVLCVAQTTRSKMRASVPSRLHC